MLGVAFRRSAANVAAHLAFPVSFRGTIGIRTGVRPFGQMNSQERYTNGGRRSPTETTVGVNSRFFRLPAVSWGRVWGEPSSQTAGGTVKSQCHVPPDTEVRLVCRARRGAYLSGHSRSDDKPSRSQEVWHAGTHLSAQGTGLRGKAISPRLMIQRPTREMARLPGRNSFRMSISTTIGKLSSK